MVNILTDSCADLGPDLLNRFHISSVPLSVIIGEQVYKDGVEISLAELFAQVDKTGKLPKTSAPSIPEFIELYKQNPGPCVYLGIGSKLSATYSNAIQAAKALGRNDIHVLDSFNLSTGIGLQVTKAADLRDAGLSAEEIVREIQATTPKVCTSFVIDTLDYLYLGGRCSAMENVVGSLLKIRPVIEVRKDGTMGVKAKIRGARKKGLDYMLDDFQEHLPNVEMKRVFVTHTGCDEDALYLKEELLKKAPVEEVLITYAGATVASHCGPNTIGILFISK